MENSENPSGIWSMMKNSVLLPFKVIMAKKFLVAAIVIYLALVFVEVNFTAFADDSNLPANRFRYDKNGRLVKRLPCPAECDIDLKLSEHVAIWSDNSKQDATFNSTLTISHLVQPPFCVTAGSFHTYMYGLLDGTVQDPLYQRLRYELIPAEGKLVSIFVADDEPFSLEIKAEDETGCEDWVAIANKPNDMGEVCAKGKVGFEYFCGERPDPIQWSQKIVVEFCLDGYNLGEGAKINWKLLSL